MQCDLRKMSTWLAEDISSSFRKSNAAKGGREKEKEKGIRERKRQKKRERNKEKQTKKEMMTK